ncbi:LOW QUALITY PROTEIN: uncharacterized protein LOC112548879, partial [Alligator sinensis]|uniref:LOW QUALITY PROTEIN: uncharacterized protein LOC112548879 n=1 Tax=Alligator sinensis TaxID=38654 RepID=A0A3Q0FZ82_ALLSI
CQEVKVDAALAEMVQLQPNTWPSSWVAIDWKVKLGSQTYWILRHDENGTSASSFLPFADRVSFHPGNLSLQINSVTEKESGLYTMDLKLGDGSGITKNFQLFVLDHVRQPNIKASTSQECGWCYLTLSCLVPKAAGVTYSWSRGESSSPAPEDHSLHEHQADLQLEITKSGNNTFYHCNVSNAISWGMATIDVKPLCNYTGCQEVKVDAALAEMVQLQPNTWPSSWVAIDWKVKFGSQTYWILRHDQNRTSVSPFLPFADSVSFHPGNLSLQINSVMEKESGLYTMDLKLGDGSGVTNNFRLFVLDRVQQPNIKASTSQKSGQCYLTLSCLVPKADRVTYSWSRGVSSSPAPEDHSLHEIRLICSWRSHQADLQLEITKSGNNTFYHCNVSNAISWGMATIDVKPLCNYTGNSMPAQASSLSYCQAKGLILLLVLGVLITGTVAVHIMAGKPPKQH